MEIFALKQRDSETYDAAGKAMRDVFCVLKKKNAKNIWSVPKYWNRYLKIVDVPYLFFFLLCKVKRDDFVFYSIPENAIKIKLVKKVQAIKHYSIICFINDLNAFRYGNLDSMEVQRQMKKEAKLIGTADYVLIPNENTKKLLTEQGVKSKLIAVGVWDYLMTEKQQSELEMARAADNHVENGKTVIAFAGNLNKSHFLNKMILPQNTKIRMELWGKLDDDRREALPQFCNYNGILGADEVPKAICLADYGLVWDGTGADEIQGGLGEYLKYNNSHKCGLYLAAGIPAIVWSGAGMAKFINENKCGLCIDRLSEIEQKIDGCDYQELKKNAIRVSYELQNGVYLECAIDKILSGELL